MQTQTIVQMKLGGLVPDKNNPRQEFGIEDMARLEQSIKARGILNPLLVEKTKEGYLILDGERRYRVAKRLGLKAVPTRINDGTLTEKDRLLVRFNLQEVHSSWTPWDKSVAIAELQALTDWNVPELARQLGVSASTIGTLLALQRLSKRTISAGQSAKLPITAIARLGSATSGMSVEKTKAVENSFVAGVEGGKIADRKAMNRFMVAARTATEAQLQKYASVKKYTAEDVLKETNSEHVIAMNTFQGNASSTRGAAKRLTAMLLANGKLKVKERTLEMATSTVNTLNRLIRAIGTRVEANKAE